MNYNNPATHTLLFTLLATGAARAQPTFYVSPTGSDLNSGTSAATPFLTLEKAQSVMQALGTAPATTILEAGAYQRTQKLDLENYDDRNKTWIAEQGQVAILTGSLKADVGIMIAEPGITVAGLSVEDFTQAGIFAKYADHLRLAGNTIVDITTPDWRTNVLGASIFVLNVQNSLITHNTIVGNTYVGIQVNGGSVGDNNSNDVVAYNTVMNTCTVVVDCGAIAFRDVGHVSTGQVILGNTIYNFGPSRNQTRGIYLDDETSHVTVSRNNVFGTGTWSIMIHGGNDNTIFNNIFDISETTMLGIYQDDVGAGGVDYGMRGNVFTRNIVYAASAPTGDLWYYLNQSGRKMGLPAVSNDLYFSPDGTLPNTGRIKDSIPIYKNPLFVNAAAHDYRLKPGSPALALGFKRGQ